MSIEIDWNALQYLPEEPTPELLEQAEEAAFKVGHDWDEEHPLHARVLAMRTLTPESQRQWYEDFPEPAPRIHRIDYVSWAVSRRFSLDLVENVVVRVEGICIDEETLTSGEIITYCMGREIEFLSWKDAVVPASLANGPLPQEVLEELVDLLEDCWDRDLLEYAEGDPTCVAHWPSPLRETAERLIREHREEDA